MSQERTQRNWPFISLASVLLAAISAGLAYFAFVPAAKRQLSVTVASSTPLVSKGIANASDIQVAYQGVKVAEPRQVVVSAVNTGNVAIEPGQVEQALELVFDQAKVLNAQISKRIPENIQVKSVVVGPSRVRVEMGVLNPANEFLISILTDGPFESPECLFRATGVDGPTLSNLPPARTTQASPYNSLFAFVVALLLFAGGIWLMSAFDKAISLVWFKCGRLRMAAGDWDGVRNGVRPESVLEMAAYNSSAALEQVGLSFHNADLAEWFKSIEKLESAIRVRGKLKDEDPTFGRKVRDLDRILRDAVAEEFISSLNIKLMGQRFYHVKKQIISELRIDTSGVSDIHGYLASKIEQVAAIVAPKIK